MPAEFPTRAVSSPEDAATYVGEYNKALGLAGVAVVRVLDKRGSYWVYVIEQETSRSAFALAVEQDGQIASKKFPTMAPEMMWNQKYGHRARPDASMIDEGLSREEARDVARRAVPKEEGVRPGKAGAYYGYVLVPLCEAEHWVGEAAVNGTDGTVVWNRFSESPRVWTPPGAENNPCD